jgi:hypothetical protein
VVNRAKNCPTLGLNSFPPPPPAWTTIVAPGRLGSPDTYAEMSKEQVPMHPIALGGSFGNDTVWNNGKAKGGMKPGAGGKGLRASAQGGGGCTGVGAGKCSA